MEDSFFGFDTRLPEDGGGGPLEELSEDEYDALNDETFGSAREDDWENLHENLVRLEKTKPANGSSPGLHVKDADDDLDFNFSRFNFDDFDISVDDTDAKVQLDPSVWAMAPSKPDLPKPSFPPKSGHGSHGMGGFFPHPPQPQPSNAGGMDILAQLMKQSAPAPIKMCTVEELERNMLSQQQGGKKEMPQSPEKKPQMPRMPMAPPPGIVRPPPRWAQMGPPPHLMGPNRGFPPGIGPPMYPMMQFPGAMPGMGGFPPHQELPLFGRMRPPPPGHPMMNVQRPPFPPNMPPHMMGMPPQNNQFNQRLVEEIQQNHPMLPFNRGGPPFGPGGPQNGNGRPQFRHQANGGFNAKPEPQDPYANLMSNRDKQWLISIQLMQLHTDTPYFDDFYFTVYKDRKAREAQESRAHVSNTMNHPFTQGPKGNAHNNMLLVTLNNKNGLNNSNRNGGQFNRERKSSESKEGVNKEQPAPRTHYTPLQFENSLGKLQVGCGSVTAPRKIIDMEVVATDAGATSAMELTAQRKTARQILLHIETLFKVVLKLEDLENPIAIAAAQIQKTKREKEIQQARDQAAINRALAGDTPGAEGEAAAIASEEHLKTLIEKYPPPDTAEELVAKLVAGLTPEKVVAMMIVRKGRTLLRRSMPFLKKNPHRWSVWCGIVSSLYVVFKKEKEIDVVLMGIYDEFEKQLGSAKLEDVVHIAQSLAAEKRTQVLLSHKYTLSIIVALIIHAETLFCNADYKKTTKDEETWQQFLKTLANSADGIKVHQANSNPIPMDNQVIKTMIQHLTRFNTVQTKPLLNLLTQADPK